ncbi:tetratricopeptide repeat protein [Coraliomargarita algicola]|uniref:Tetratricopeptide repeat protein n=1 Tax=Coraliomargarita algicola TaxID=3092156 RepID=A0ABZ0RLS8_9BACT|nr:tetratricopeptide repeat protein [Coraliomargarita sp. J2-16]WPJ97170.1 tetratricopeptide repeat protein [Coraliomargarita sp. J2-16]
MNNYPYKKSVFILCLSILLNLLSFGAAPKGGESTAGQLQRVKALINSQQLVQARPIMQRLKQAPDVEKRLHSTFDFYIALSYVFDYYDAKDAEALNQAITLFTDFIKKYPRNTLVPMARYNIADLHAVSKNYKEALKAYIPLYTNPVPGIERNEVLQKIILIYIVEDQWVAGMPYFEAGMRTSDSSEDRTTYAAYLLIAKAKQGDVSDSREFLSFFNSSAPVFYTPRFNASLMEIGDQLRKAGDLATASLFYRFVRSYESLEVGLGHYVRRLKREITQYEDNPVLRNFYQQTKTKLDNAEADLTALKASTNYTPLLNWRIASVYMDMGREWEAYWRFRVMVDEYPDHEYAEDIIFSSFSLGHKLGESEDAELLGKRYLENQNFKRYRATIADTISTDYLEGGEFQKVYQISRWYAAIDPNDPAASLLLFKHGMARLMRFETSELIRDFQLFRENYGETKSSLVINYFLGLGYLTEERHQIALERFEDVLANPSTRFRADAFFRKALCVMGLDRLDEARDLLLEFVERYPDNVLRAQAELVLGNLVNLLGDVENALGHYYLIEQYTDDPGLLASGELKIAQILFDRGEETAALERLQNFIQSYPEESEIIPVVVALAGFYDQLEQPRVALNTIRGPLDQFFEMTEVDELDGLLVDYLKKDRSLRAMRRETEAFLGRVSETPELLKELIGDRGKQYRYFKQHPQIDALVKYRFVQDNAFRNEILEHYKVLDEAHAQRVAEFTASQPEATPPEQAPYPVVTHPVLEALKAEIEQLNEAIPATSADDWLAGRLAQAQQADDIPLVVRIEAALAAAEEPNLKPRPEFLALVHDEVLWPQLGLAGQIWILQEFAHAKPEEVIVQLEASKLDYMNSSLELEMHQLLAECYQQVGRTRDAIDRYKLLIKRFAAADQAGEAALRIGRMEIDAQNYDAAREQLETILYRNEWRGQRHGDALLWIGRAYVAEGKFSEAHGFFERIMLGYPGFNELLATVYYEDILVLKQMGELESAQTVYEAFQITPGLEDTEAAALIRKEF